MVMEVVAADRTSLAKKKKNGALQGHAQVNPSLGTSCLGPVGLET
jgi:hypothetical protein